MFEKISFRKQLKFSSNLGFTITLFFTNTSITLNRTSISISFPPSENVLAVRKIPEVSVQNHKVRNIALELSSKQILTGEALGQCLCNLKISRSHIKKIKRKFLGGPVVRTWHFTAVAWVQSLVRELRSHNHMVCPDK